VRIKFGVLRAAEEMLAEYRVACGRHGMALAHLTGRQEALAEKYLRSWSQSGLQKTDLDFESAC
jgi:hypothetical protein